MLVYVSKQMLQVPEGLVSWGISSITLVSCSYFLFALNSFSFLQTNMVEQMIRIIPTEITPASNVTISKHILPDAI